MPSSPDNAAFLTYGMIAAWLILAIYVMFLAARERKMKREIASLRALVEEQRR